MTEKSELKMARKKIREYDSKRLLKEHLKRLAGIEMDIKSAHMSGNIQINIVILFEGWILWVS